MVRSVRQVTVIGVRLSARTAAYKLVELHLKWRGGTKIPPRFGTACPHRLLGRQNGSWVGMSYCRRFLRIAADTETYCRLLSSRTAGTATPHCRWFLRITAGTIVFPGNGGLTVA